MANVVGKSYKWGCTQLIPKYMKVSQVKWDLPDIAQIRELGNRNKRENFPLSWTTLLRVRQQNCSFLLFLWSCHLYFWEYSECVQGMTLLSSRMVSVCPLQWQDLFMLWECSATNEVLVLCCSVLTLLKILITDRLSQPHQFCSKSVSTQVNTF